MKSICGMVRAGGFAAILLASTAGCMAQSGDAAGNPRVVVIPADELSREPSLAPATEQSATPAPEATIAVKKASVTKPAAPRKHSYNSCNVEGPYISITFDDGPHPTLTPKLLDLLKDRGIRATFYILGQNAAQYPDIVKRMAAEGHEVANHTWTHPALSRTSASRVKSELERTSALIKELTGKAPTTMRPPYGATNAALNRRFDEEFGMKSILWSVDPLDWKYRNATRVANEILENTRPGGIVLAHDIHPSTIAAMPAALDGLLAKGFKFVTVEELITMDRPIEVAKAESTPQP